MPSAGRHFVIELDGRWEHRSTVVEVTAAGGTRELAGRLAGHDVLDLAGNPFTNALVLRTRDVPVGGGPRSWPPMSRRRG